MENILNASELVIKQLEVFGDYSNEDRAIPSIYDGLKPVQRKILWGAHLLKLSASSKPRKGINLLGAVVPYYLHGDDSVKEAITRSGQNFKMTYPLLKIIGNAGGQSLLKAPHSGAAALRYLEIRLTEMGEEILNSIKNGTAKMGRNFDNTADEPQHFFAPIPYFLLSNVKGIGVGTSTSIPSFKKKSVIETTRRLIEDPELSFKEIADILQPFYIQGATVVNKSDLAQIYSHVPRDGKKGSIKFRATFQQIENKLVVTNLPFSASPTGVIEEIQAQIDKGKTIFNSIQRAQDTTSLTKTGEEVVSMELVLKPKTDIEQLTNALCEFTSLQSYANINLVMLDKNDKPKEYNIKTALLDWIEIYREKTEDKLNSEKQVLEKKLNILLGLIKALDEIDEIIALIKASDSRSGAKIKLVQKGYNETQADAILDMKLSKLANLEYQELLNKKDGVAEEIERLRLILTSESEMKKIMISELVSFSKNDYAQNCKIIDSELIKVGVGKSDDFYVTSVNGTLKVSGEVPKVKHAVGTKNMPVYVFAGSDVVPIKNSKDPGVYGVLHILKGDSDVFHVSKDGYIKRSEVSHFLVTKKSSAAKMEEVVLVTQDEAIVIVTTNKNNKYQASLSKLKATGRTTKGSRVFKLEDEYIVKAEVRQSYLSNVPKC